MTNLYLKRILLGVVVLTQALIATPDASANIGAEGVRIKDLAKLQGVRENALVGYGLVIGLAGTGDSSRSKSTMQSISNTLIKFGVTVDKNDIQSRNVAAVLVTAKLPPFSEIGETIDVQVSSIGDAKSLLGGNLLLTPLNAPNGKIYALAQGSLTVGGYKYDSLGNLVQKNHPTVGIVSKGATVEQETTASYFKQGRFSLLLNESDFTTADRITFALNSNFSDLQASVDNPGKVTVSTTTAMTTSQLNRLLARVENIQVAPDVKARVVVNERTGTIVSGGNVKVSPVTISHGNIKLEIKTDYLVSQPEFVFRTGANVSTAVVPDTEITVEEGEQKSVTISQGTTITELIDSLKAINLTTRDTITILQAIKQSGALHAELVIQ